MHIMLKHRTVISDERLPFIASLPAARDRANMKLSDCRFLTLLTFLQAYGMMGWRIGYIAYPDADGRGGKLGGQLLKTQDTICICACQVRSDYAYLRAKHVTVQIGSCVTHTPTYWFLINIRGDAK